MFLFIIVSILVIASYQDCVVTETASLVSQYVDYQTADAKNNPTIFSDLVKKMKKDFKALKDYVVPDLSWPNEYGMMYHVQGSNPGLKAIHFGPGHMDVVGSEDEALFEGVIDTEECIVIGRGTENSKGYAIAGLYALDQKLAAGYTPVRDIWITVSFTEELSPSYAVEGKDFAQNARNYLQTNGVEFFISLEEALPFVFPAGYIDMFVNKPTFFYDATNHFYGTYKVTTHAVEGHTSIVFPNMTAAYKLAKIVEKVDSYGWDVPGNWDYWVNDKFLKEIFGYETSEVADLAAVYLFGAFGVPVQIGQTVEYNTMYFGLPPSPLPKYLFMKYFFSIPQVDQSLKYSTAGRVLLWDIMSVSMGNWGIQENVSPGSAEGIINVRFLAEDNAGLERTAEQVTAIVSAVVGDQESEDIDLELLHTLEYRLPNNEHHQVLDMYGEILEEMHGVPFQNAPMLIGGSNAAEYSKISEWSSVAPCAKYDDVGVGVHGADEDIKIAALEDCRVFFDKFFDKINDPSYLPAQ